jgi:O-antigen/teichoic acid export membrane protein
MRFELKRGSQLARRPIDIDNKVGYGKELGIRWIAISSSHLVLTALVTSLLGYTYWIVAARYFSVSAVGHTAALVSTMFLIMELAHMGMGLGLAYILPTAKQNWSGIVNSVMVAVALFATVFSLLVMVGGAALNLQIATVARSGQFLALFIISCIMWTLSVVLDQILTVEKATGLVLLRNTISSSVRLLLLPMMVLAASADSSMGLFAGWGMSAALSLVFAIVLFAWKNPFSRRLAWQFDKKAVREILPLSLSNHLLTTIEAAPSLILPILVASFLSTEANAYFYTAWMTAIVVHTIPTSISKVLFIRNAATGKLSQEMLWKMLIFTLIVVGPLTIAMIAARELILSLFGQDYVKHSSMLLSILVFSAIPFSICRLYISVERVLCNFKRAFGVAIAIFVITVSVACLVITTYGLVAVGLAFCVSHLAIAVFCLIDLWFSSNTR